MWKNPFGKSVGFLIFLVLIMLYFSFFIGFSIGGDNGSSTFESVVSVRPVANISSGDFYENVAGSIIAFNASGSFDPDGNITGYRWDFNGNGSYDTTWLNTPTVNHIFSDSGVYTVILQVKDDSNKSDVDSAVVDISNNPAVVEIKCKTMGITSQNISFEASILTNISIVNYTWIFGDDVIAYGEKINHIYNSPGSYFVKLVVEDNEHDTYHDIAFLEIKLDTDKDFLSNEIENRIGSPIWTPNSFITFQINQKVHFLVDIDNDKVFDVFYNKTSKNFSYVDLSGTDFLIDDDCDGQYDYKYNTTTGSVETYNIENDEGNNGTGENSTPGVPMTSALFVILVMAIVFIRHRRDE